MYLRNITTYFSILSILLILGCSDNNKTKNPNQTGFDASNSDQKAIEIADNVMAAVGGQKNWDEARYIVWDFFGERKLYWDKMTGNVRIVSLKDNFIVLVNIHDMTGRVGKNGKEVTDPETLNKFLAIGKSMWINDSYWLVMPFKLKDPGVNLNYLRQDTTSEGKVAEVIQLTFDSVGETPQNKYEIYVDTETNLVADWAYFKNANNEKPEFKNAWKHYKRYGNILLSFDRGNGRFLTDIEVLEEMPPEIFTDF